MSQHLDSRRSLGQRLVREYKMHKWLYFMVLPGIAIIFLFNYVPMYGIVISMKKYQLKLGIMGSPWVGFEFFKELFETPMAFRAIRNTIILGVSQLLWGFPAPIILALMLNEVKNARYKKVVQTISYFPHFVSTVIIIGMLAEFCRADGLFNDFRALFGVKRFNLMDDPAWFRTLYVGSGIWQGVGYGTIIYLAALSGVDPELYDAADIDGAGRLCKIWHITLPYLRMTIVILFIMNVGSLFGSDTTKILLMYSPRTYETADTIGTYTYREGITGARFEYSTAVGLFQTVVNFVFVLLTNMISRKVSDISLF